MVVHVCGSDGQSLGEFEEQTFIEHLFANKFPQDSYYWHEGMADWAPISQYRALAKTQRISFKPPTRKTVKINIQEVPQPAEKPKGPLQRLWKRLRKPL